MKKTAFIVIPLFVITVAVVLIYLYFFKFNSVYAHFGHDITITSKESGNYEDELYIKTLDIEDNGCTLEDCSSAGEETAKLLLINQNKIEKVTMGVLADNVMKVYDGKYTIELKVVNKDDITFKVTKNEVEE